MKLSKQSIDLATTARLIKESRRTLFFIHISPDGDCVGSSLGLVRALRQAGHEAVIAGVDPVPRIYQFLPGWDELFVPWQEVEGEWDLACFLDCADMDRPGAALPLVERCKQVLNVDHHSTNTQFGDYNYVDGRAAAVGEMVYRIIRAMGLPVDAEMATCLYTAIVADTGGFKYDSTAPSTHRAAADLLEAGARPYEVASQIWENETAGRLSLLGRALSGMKVDAENGIAWLQVTRQMLAETGADEADVEGLVNYARSISGVEVGAIFREAADGLIRVGLRSRRQVDVGAIAKEFGGGGHARAAGCGVEGSLDEVTHRVLNAVRAKGQA